MTPATIKPAMQAAIDAWFNPSPDTPREHPTLADAVTEVAMRAWQDGREDRA